MKYIIYLGVFFMPDGNAACGRAWAFSEMIQKCGYIPVIIGMDKQENNKNILDTEVKQNNTLIYSMPYPDTSFEWLKMLGSIKGLKEVVNHIGENNIKAIIAMDYFSPALLRMIRFCNKKSIRFIVDAVDWFVRSNYSFPKRVIKDLDTKIRMLYIYKRIDYMIAISDFLAGYYQKKVKNIVQIPGVIAPSFIEKLGEDRYKKNTLLTLVFAGDPGKRCEKEKIDWLMKIICKLNAKSIKIKFIVIGIDKETLFYNRPDLARLPRFDHSVECLGKIPHTECLKFINLADFSVIIREDTLLSRAGFPTKLAESYACGTPVFVTPTSNICDFIPDKYGVIAKDCTYASLKIAVQQLLNMNASEISSMHKTVRKCNLLNCDKYADRMKKILER